MYLIPLSFLSLKSEVVGYNLFVVRIRRTPPSYSANSSTLSIGLMYCAVKMKFFKSKTYFNYQYLTYR